MIVSFYLTRPKAETPTSIFARICYNNLKLKYYTPESILPKYWSKENHRAKQTEKFKEYPEFNQRLDDFEADVKNVYRTYVNDNGGKEPSTAILRNLLDKFFEKTAESEQHERQLKTFWGFYNDFLKRCENGSRLHHKNNTPLAANTIKNFKNLKEHLQAFEKWQKKRIDFETIDLKFHQSFTGYLTTEKKLSVNFIGKLITTLKVILREAFEMGFNPNLAFSQKKFKSYQVETQTIYLTEPEILELKELDLSANKRLERVRDLFVIGCYTGLRFSDLSKLSHDHIKDGIIEIEQTKTKDPVYIPVRSEVKQLLDKYTEHLPTAISNQKFNNYLKEVCENASLLKKEVTLTKIEGGKKVKVHEPKYKFVHSHTARRSFATNEYLAGDLQTFEIRAITGHKTDKAFYKYIRQTPRENAANVAKKWQERELKRAAITPHLKAV
jgi:integrase